MRTRKTPRTAKRKYLDNFCENLTAKAKEIMTCPLEDLVFEIQPLFTALYLSCPKEANRLLKMYPNSPAICSVANDTIMYRADMDRLKRIVDKGFFQYELRNLLKFGMDVPIAGTRLVPIFFAALEHAKELGLSEDLQDDIKQYIELCKVRDGFVIVSASNENLVLHFAKDVLSQ